MFPVQHVFANGSIFFCPTSSFAGPHLVCSYTKSSCFLLLKGALHGAQPPPIKQADENIKPKYCQKSAQIYSPGVQDINDPGERPSFFTPITKPAHRIDTVVVREGRVLG